MPTELDLQAADALDQAADVLLRDGLMKDHYGTNDGPKCVYGALSYALTGQTILRERYDVCDIMTQALRDTTGRPYLAIWNDQLETTVADVIDGCRRAAKHLREDAHAR